MPRSRLLRRAFTVVLPLLLGARAGAQEPPPTLSGTVEAAALDLLEVRTAEGRRDRIALRPETRVVAGTEARTRGDLKAGQRVAVIAEDRGGRRVATEVRILDASGGHAHHRTDEASRLGPRAGDPHAGHGAAGAAGPTLFESDMSRMAGLTSVPAAPASDGWTTMTLGFVRGVFNDQGGPSGDEGFESTNWAMLMAQRPLGRGLLTLMSMHSLEPATLRDGGSPQLFQTGETYQGRPLVDRQHAHDLFMNLSAAYRVPAGPDGAAWVQLGLVGEPALGPTAFMHRASAGENPSSPLGHHWLDSSHITSTVVTVGGAWRGLALEASAFHGEEPDEDRWDLDLGGLDSASLRARVRLPEGFSAHASYGYLKEPEALEPGDLRRTTAGIAYGAEGDRPLAALLLWGRNDEEHGVSDAFLLEGAWQITGRDHVYARAEAVEKDRHLLADKIRREDAGGRDDHDDLVTVRALTLGYLRDFELFGTLRVGLAGDLTFYSVPGGLRAVYGDSPVSTHLFVRLRWGTPHAGHSRHPVE